MKILGSDFDGTLNHGGLTEAKLEAIAKWQRAGNKFGIVSGRSYDFREILLREFPQLHLDFLVACNGGYILDGQGNSLYEARCTAVPFLALADDLFGWGCLYIHFKGEIGACVVKQYEDAPSYVAKERVCLLENLPKVDYFNQVSVQLPSAEKSADMVKRIQAKYGEWINPLQNGACIDLVPAGVNKAQGMYRVMEAFGCAYEDVITVGDNINDLDMIREFRSYAMQNGVQTVKDLADGIVCDVTEILEQENAK